jgi:hypothetical protein
MSAPKSSAGIEPGERWVWCYADEVMPGELPE